MDCNAVSSLSWVPRGYARKNPIKNAHYCMDDEDVERYFVNHNIEHELKGAYLNSNPSDKHLCELQEIDYDDSYFYGENFFQTVEKGLIKCHKDPNMRANTSMDSDEDDALEIKEDDSLLATTSIEDDIATLQVYLYSNKDGSFYVHHDILIGDYPLCSEWTTLGSFNKKNNNLLIIGSFSGEITLWNLDYIDSIDPILTIGSNKNGNNDGHSNAIMSLAVHSKNSKVLASGSADESIKLWDLNENKLVNTYFCCNDKVQCLKWHHTENNILLTADYNKIIQFIDIRDSNSGLKLKYEDKKGDPESIVVPGTNNFYNGNAILISTENGFISAYDIRMLSESHSRDIFSILANYNMKPVTSICCTLVPNMLVSCDLDGVAKVWDLSNMSSFVIEKQLKGGKLFTSSNCPDEDAVVAFGGESIILWNITQEELVSKVFESR